MRIALVGAGNVGTAVASLLARKGHEVVGVASRSPDSAAAAAERLGTEVHGVSDLPDADVILLGVSDAALESASAEVAGRLSSATQVWHFAGSFGVSVLDAVSNKGAKACATHPVQACPNVEAAIARLPGSAWGVTCSDRNTEAQVMELISGDLDGYPVPVAEEFRSIWHAAAVATSNGVAALLAAGEMMLSDIGIDDPMRVLGPLAEGTLQNALEGGGGAPTLTGPVVRGEKETVRRHVQALRDKPGSSRQYRAAAFLIVQAAVAAGRIDEAFADEILAEFDS